MLWLEWVINIQNIILFMEIYFSQYKFTKILIYLNYIVLWERWGITLICYFGFLNQKWRCTKESMSIWDNMKRDRKSCVRRLNHYKKSSMNINKIFKANFNMSLILSQVRKSYSFKNIFRGSNTWKILLFQIISSNNGVDIWRSECT